MGFDEEESGKILKLYGVENETMFIVTHTDGCWGGVSLCSKFRLATVGDID